jgi:hypothetical protein
MREPGFEGIGGGGGGGARGGRATIFLHSLRCIELKKKSRYLAFFLAVLGNCFGFGFRLLVRFRDLVLV